MTHKRRSPFGSWRSPISAAMVAAQTTSPSGTLGQMAGSGSDLYWVELRPKEGGRNVVMRYTADGKVEDVTAPPHSARSIVHEYGGGSIFAHGKSLFFSNYDDQRLYRVDPDAKPRPITPEPPSPRSDRYSDGRVIADGRFIVCVRERHLDGGQVMNELVSVPADGSSEPAIVASGRDFYACPRPSPDGSRLAWIAWDDPQMPWDGTEVWVAALHSDGSVERPEIVAGGPGESLFQPEWSPSSELHFVSDRSGWWSLYRTTDHEVEALPTLEADFGTALWQLGFTRYCFAADGAIVCTYSKDGFDHLGRIRPGGSSVEPIETGLTSFYPPQFIVGGSGRIGFIAGSATDTQSVRLLDLSTGKVEVIYTAFELTVDPAFISIPHPISYPTEGGALAHALFYPPANRDFTGNEGERPPLIVISHGGPTSATRSHLQLGIQYWTSRGFGVVDVDYGGSTGYGRAYRMRLNGMWGVVDKEDCINAARYLAEHGEVDGRRMLIRGGSAGGYTTLCALAFDNVFAGGASYYGVADLEPFVTDTHKFEARYMDSLVGAYPEARETYRARSPIHFADQISCPIILFHGLEDKIVPPSQAEIMVEALRKKGLPFAYIAFEGEQHGFRRSETVQRALEAELYFYSQVLGFGLSEHLEPVKIENL